MAIFKTILIILVGLIAAVLAIAATKPDEFRVQRQINIKAPPEKIFSVLNDFHQFEAWSPWKKLDPAMKLTLSGAEKGKGAIYHWVGNDKAGEGRMEILESTPSSKIVIKLDFIKPFEGNNITEYILQPQADSTTLSWVMYGPSPFISKIMQVFVSMDSLIGKDFEEGLGNLKALIEK